MIAALGSGSMMYVGRPFQGRQARLKASPVQIFRRAYRIARRRVVMSFTSCNSTTSAAMRATR